MKKRLAVFICAIIFVVFLNGCLSTPRNSSPELINWTHTVEASEYTKMEAPNGQEYLVYRYEDERFNKEDWFDTWIEDWAGGTGGWSRFIPVMDGSMGMFMYDVLYNNGTATWYAYTADLDLIVGHTLRFYRMRN